MFFFTFIFVYSAELFAKWRGSNEKICHSMIPCSWDVALEMFKKDDIIHLADNIINTSEQLDKFENTTNFVLKIGGGLAADNCIIDGKLVNYHERDFYLELSPFNESILFGFKFVNFRKPIFSIRGMDLFIMANCSFHDNIIQYDFPMITLSNVSVIFANNTISGNTVNSTSLVGLYTAILGIMNSTIENNTQLSHGSIPLFEFTNAASEITDSTIRYNKSPKSPLFGSWFFIIVIVTRSIITDNMCNESALIVGDSLANITFDTSKIDRNNGALLHSMTMSSINMSASSFSDNFAKGQTLIFAPRSTVQLLNYTIFANNIASSIVSSQLSNHSSLELSSTIIRNNTCEDTAFALLNANSAIANSNIENNVVFHSPFIEITNSNFSIHSSQFVKNYALNSSIFKLDSTNILVDYSVFRDNFGNDAGLMTVSGNSQSVFLKSNFKNNNGSITKSIYFHSINNISGSEECMFPPARFEYCNFSDTRFNEVNGVLGDNQLFHRCRFLSNRYGFSSEAFQHHSGFTRPSVQPEDFLPYFTFYIISMLTLVISYFMWKGT